MSIFIISIILLSTIIINFYPEKVNNDNLMDGRVTEIHSNGFLIESEKASHAWPTLWMKRFLAVQRTIS